MSTLKHFKLVCPKCGYKEIVTPKSDSIELENYLGTCQNCNVDMERIPWIFDNAKKRNKKLIFIME